MKLLLDEHYSDKIAEQLRKAGHDARAVTETEFLGIDDAALLLMSTSESRVLCTNNVRDFALLARRWTEAGQIHSGLIFTSDDSMPRSVRSVGRFVGALGKLFTRYPEDDSLQDQIHWL